MLGRVSLFHFCITFPFCFSVHFNTFSDRVFHYWNRSALARSTFFFWCASLWLIHSYSLFENSEKLKFSYAPGLHKMPQKLLLSKKKYKNKQTRKHLYLSYVSYHHRESDELKPCPQLLNISFFSSPFYSVSTAQPHLSIYNTGLNGRILLPSPLSPLPTFFFF